MDEVETNLVDGQLLKLMICIDDAYKGVIANGRQHLAYPFAGDDGPLFKLYIADGSIPPQ